MSETAPQFQPIDPEKDESRKLRERPHRKYPLSPEKTEDQISRILSRIRKIHSLEGMRKFAELLEDYPTHFPPTLESFRDYLSDKDSALTETIFPLNPLSSQALAQSIATKERRIQLIEWIHESIKGFELLSKSEQ